MNTWLIPSFIALVNFGLWGFFTKLAVNHIDAKSAFFYQTLGAAVIGLLGLYFMGLKPSINIKGITFAVLTGGAYSLGCLFYFIAASRGNIVTIVTITALYPLVSIIFAYTTLHEAISVRQSLGIIFAIAAMVLFTT